MTKDEEEAIIQKAARTCMSLLTEPLSSVYDNVVDMVEALEILNPKPDTPEYSLLKGLQKTLDEYHSSESAQ